MSAGPAGPRHRGYDCNADEKVRHTEHVGPLELLFMEASVLEHNDKEATDSPQQETEQDEHSSVAEVCACCH